MMTENMTFLFRFLMHVETENVFFHFQCTLTTGEFDSDYLYLIDELKKKLFNLLLRWLGLFLLARWLSSISSTLGEIISFTMFFEMISLNTFTCT